MKCVLCCVKKNKRRASLSADQLPLKSPPSAQPIQNERHDTLVVNSPTTVAAASATSDPSTSTSAGSSIDIASNTSSAATARYAVNKDYNDASIIQQSSALDGNTLKEHITLDMLFHEIKKLQHLNNAAHEDSRKLQLLNSEATAKISNLEDINVELTSKLSILQSKLNVREQREKQLAVDIVGVPNVCNSNARVGAHIQQNDIETCFVKHLKESLSRDGVPLIVLKPIHTLPTYINHKQLSIEYKPKTTENLNYKTSTIRKRQKFASSWDIQEPFRLELHGIDNVNCDLNPTPEIGVHLGLFHGERRLCALQKSTELPVDNDGKIVFNEAIAFDIFLQNVPRSARLCISIYAKTVKLSGSRSKKISTSKESKDSKDIKDSKDNKESAKDNREYRTSPLAWVNTTLFDYRHQLKTGQLTLHTWTNADDIQSDEIFHPLGTVEPNPRNEDCAVVKLTFHNYNCENGIIYPEEETVLLHAEKLAETENLNRSKSQDKKIIQKVLASYSRSDKLDEMHDQDRNDIWSNRLDCRNECPEELSILLHCVNWNERNEVAEIWSLLKDWPCVSVERSLELLDYAYPDPAVRNFSIRCLRQLKDEELLLYLLQLVQAIKHEAYLDSDLVCFVLERALRNQRIGHYFFWHLRSEMQTPSMQVRFGLLLEAYLKGCKSHVPLLHKQVQCLEKLKQGSESAKKGSKEKSRHSLQTFLANDRIGAVFKGIQSPLNPSFRCKGVKPDKCKVMDSKMRPLWVVFENADMLCDDIYIIFKNGDDLRQDMLTLQMLRVMDQLWKNEGLDFRMNIYNCISMERRLGMIEVVLNAETIANIQKVKGMFSATSPFQKGSLFSWLKEHNNTEEEMNKAVEEFTLSCAGYCVATYVLGVADRHSDNIMVKKNGQLFHIDFGHILGHFKEKFGVRRERVPFVLTHDFVYVINKGRTDREAEEFRYFQKLCEDAFLILREHGCLILSLFSMMISTGLPELSSEKDLNYLKETLVLELTKENAREHFRSKFSEALANSWKTSLNWASHNFSKNNKQ